MKDYIKSQKQVRAEDQAAKEPIADKVHSKVEDEPYGKVVKKAIESAKESEQKAKDEQMKAIAKQLESSTDIIKSAVKDDKTRTVSEPLEDHSLEDHSLLKPCQPVYKNKPRDFTSDDLD